MYTDLALCINGRFIPAGAGRASEPVLDPATGEVLAELPHANSAEIEEALSAAECAFAQWKETPALRRSSILREAAAILRGRLESLCPVMTLEQGKPLAESRGEWLHAIEVLEWCAEEGRRSYGRIIPSRDDVLDQFVFLEPVGPAAVFTPWNFPALTPARKLGAGLAAGCAVILKAAEETPGCAVEILRALHEAGLPPGCAQLIFGNPPKVSEQLICSRVIQKISFTGSTPVGKQLMGLAAKGAKRTTMELGGNAPVLIFDDADYARTLQIVTAAKFRNAGQVCISPARFFVHERLFERFVADVSSLAAELCLGHGLDPNTTMGPLANSRRVEAMERFLSDAERRGGAVHCGGGRYGSAGDFFRPTVISGLGTDALLFNEECFGPILPIAPFSTLDEAIEKANGVAAGLAGYVFTTSLATARSAMHRLKVGMVGINTLAISSPETPFGGVGESGHGSEGGTEGLMAFLQTKLVSMG